MSGEDGTTRNTEFSEPYYVKTGCFNASDRTKCTVNPSEYVRSSSGARGEFFWGGASYLILDSRIHKCYPWCFTPLFLCLSLSLCMSLSLPALCSRCPRSMPFFRYGINLPTGQTVDGDGGTDDPLRTRKEICATNSQTGAYRGNTDK